VVIGALAAPSAAYAADRTPPTVPQGVRVTGATDDSVSFAWNASTDASGSVTYRVYVNGLRLGSSAQPSHTVTERARDTSLTFVVRAEDRYGNVSQPSAPVTATTTGGAGGVGAPSNLRVTGSSYDAVSLAWEPATTGSAELYQILRDGRWVDSAYGTTATVRYLAAGTAYTLEVRSRDSQGNLSAPVAVRASTRTDTGPPSTPANLRAVTDAVGTPVGLEWDSSTDDRGVGIYWLFANGDAVFAGGPGVDLATLTDSLCTVARGETYVFSVRAQDLSGTMSAAGESVTVSIP
jgi:chitodextrinase